MILAPLPLPLQSVQTQDPVSRQRLTPFSLRHEAMLKAKAGKPGFEGTEGFQMWVKDSFDNMAMFANNWISGPQRAEYDELARRKYRAWLIENNQPIPLGFFFPSE